MFYSMPQLPLIFSIISYEILFILSDYKFLFILVGKKFRINSGFLFFMKFIPLPFLYIVIYPTNL